MVENKPIPSDFIESKIYLIRGQKVMLDSDLAFLYGVLTKALNQQVRRNIGRFPRDFMFQLSAEEASNLKSQFVTSSSGHGGKRKLPLVFTEQGIAMLSSVLKSERAIQVNIVIMRAFVQMRRLLTTQTDLARKLEDLEKKYDKRFVIVFQAIKELMKANAEDPKPRPEIGFRLKS